MACKISVTRGITILMMGFAIDLNGSIFGRTEEIADAVADDLLTAELEAGLRP